MMLSLDAFTRQFSPQDNIRQPRSPELVGVDSAQTIASPQLDYDLAIVGGGIIGNTLAVALQNSGLRVVSIESQSASISVAKGRAYVISLLSGQIFAGLGIWKQVLPQVTQFSQIQISDC